MSRVVHNFRDALPSLSFSLIINQFKCNREIFLTELSCQQFFNYFCQRCRRLAWICTAPSLKGGMGETTPPAVQQVKCAYKCFLWIMQKGFLHTDHSLHATGRCLHAGSLHYICLAQHTASFRLWAEVTESRCSGVSSSQLASCLTQKMHTGSSKYPACALVVWSSGIST